MAFRLKLTRSLKANVKRLVRRQLDKAKKCARATDKSQAEIVHDIRKCFKRIRAVFRLVRDALGNAEFRKDNDALRDAARPLAVVRDAKIMLEALDKLTERYPDDQDAEAFAGLHWVLEQEQKTIEQKVLNESNALGDVTRVIAKIQTRVGSLDLPRKRWSVVRLGIQRVYQQGREAWHAAEANRDPKSLHEWRKQAKYLWHQLEILQDLSSWLKGHADQLHRLTQLLGDDHDLVVLRAKAITLIAPADHEVREKLFGQIDRRREELLNEAFALGRQLFTEPCKEIAQQLKKQWDSWAPIGRVSTAT
jgi:CHAD domain-containing protein